MDNLSSEGESSEDDNADPDKRRTSKFKVSEEDGYKVVELKNMLEIVIKRKDIVKYVQNDIFVKKAEGCLVKTVIKTGDYIVAEIEKFQEIPEKAYDIDLGTHGAPKKEKTTLWVRLRDATEKKVWRIKMSEISDRPVTEEEFIKFKSSWEKAKKCGFTWQNYQDMKDKFKTALPFMFKREDLNKNVFDKHIKKINQGNFVGLCLIDLRVQLQQVIDEQKEEIEHLCEPAA